MKDNSIIEKLKIFWREIFGDEDDYINLIFDNLYNKNTSRYILEDGEVIASIVGVPHSLLLRKSSPHNLPSNRESADPHHTLKLNGVYICGVSTRKDKRTKGIMQNLMNELHDDLCRQGYDFAFLIPASDTLRRYYNSLGYSNLSYKESETIDIPQSFLSNISLYSFNIETPDRREPSTEIEKPDADYIAGNPIICKEIAVFIHDYEQNFEGNIILHTLNNIEIAIQELILSGGNIYISRDTTHRKSGSADVISSLSSVAFLSEIANSDTSKNPDTDSRRKAAVNFIASRSEADSKRIITEIIKREKLDIIEIRKKVRSDINGVKTAILESQSSVISRSPYAQIKILRFSEILKFATDRASDLKYSILANQDEITKKLIQDHLFSGKSTLGHPAEPNRVKEVESKASHRLNEEIADMIAKLPTFPVEVNLMLD